ncbi:Uncharacterized protein TPAR_04870 [Tolypocladium paradoxum]|uniref:Uncharacterized protein n=1 Tax=Tolypocladium paradoxum TaxID=94208 RepID=A0A2S4KXM7_9HYPO|nr:Uncharacterized protein TPAR_04870 [Tolypocladium paradoxum]
MSRPSFSLTRAARASSIDVVGTTTAPLVEAHRAGRQLELIPLLLTLYGNGLDTCFPCPARPASRYHSGQLPAVEAGWINDNFSSQNWAAEIKIATQNDGAGDTGPARKAWGSSGPLPSRVSSWDWQRLASIYQAAVAIYCISSLLGYEDPGNSELQIMHGLQRDLRRCKPDERRVVQLSASASATCCRGSRGSAAKAGHLAIKLTRPMRPLFESELAWISSTLGIASLLVGRHFLQGRWQRPASWHDEKGQTWGGLFDLPYIFAV